MKKCIGEGQGSCKRCEELGIWNRHWMCFLFTVEGHEGTYCYECAKELENKKCEVLNDYIDGISLERIKQDLLNGRRDSISTKTFEAIIDLLEDKIKECEIFRKGNDEKNELLERLGCPTKGAARKLAFTLQEQEQQIENLKQEVDKWKNAYEISQNNLADSEQYTEELEEKVTNLHAELSCYGATGICEVCTETSVLKSDKYRKALVELKEIINKYVNEVLNEM